jgi:hypothetical protein
MIYIINIIQGIVFEKEQLGNKPDLMFDAFPEMVPELFDMLPDLSQ